MRIMTIQIWVMISLSTKARQLDKARPRERAGRSPQKTGERESGACGARSDGDREEALREAHKWFFLDYLNDGDSVEGIDLITAPEEAAGAFLLDYDELLGFITAREVRDHCLDLDEEFETRLWFHENRGKRKAA